MGNLTGNTDGNACGVKYPKQLAVNETSSRRQLDLLEQIDKIKLFSEKIKLFDDEAEPLVAELKKSMYAFNVAYSTIFDGLSLVCSELHDKQWEDTAGQLHDIVGRQKDNTETHYRMLAPESFIKAVLTGPHESDWPEVRNELLKLSLKTEKKKLAISKTQYIIDAPIKVSPWYDTDDIGKFENLSPRRKGQTEEEREEQERQTGKAKGRIIGFSIEFFKPLFHPLLEANSKNNTGGKYLLTPPYFQLKLKHLYNTFVIATKDGIREQRQELKEQGLLFTDKESKKTLAHNKLQLQIKEREMLRKIESVSTMDVRKFFLALALKDNHKGDYITIENLTEFVDGIWPRLIRTDKQGNKFLYPAQYEEAIEKINQILLYLKTMAHRGNMDGGQIVPLEIMPGEEFTRETNSLRIKCIKRSTLYSRYTLNNLLEDFTQ